MKKNLSIIHYFLFIIVLCLTGNCSKSANQDVNSTSSTPVQSPETNPVKSLGEFRTHVFPAPPQFARDVITKDTTLIGHGYNSATATQRAPCVQFNFTPEELTTASGSTANSGTFRLDRISSFDQMRDSLHVAASASFGFGFFGGDATFNYLKSGSHSSYKDYVFVESQVENPAEQLKSLRLTNTAIQAASQGAGKFLAECGDEFVFARRNGGLLRGIIQFETSSDEDQSAVASKIDASIPIFGSGSGEFQNALSQLKTVSKSSVFILEQGGIGDTPTTIDGLIGLGGRFKDMIKANPSFLEYETEGYDTIEGSSQYDAIGKLHDLARQQNDAIRTLANYVDKAYEIKADLMYYQANKKQFDWDSENSFPDIWKANENTIKQITKEAEVCRDDPENNCKADTAYDYVVYKISRKSSNSDSNTSPTPAPKPCESQWIREEGGQRFAEWFHIDATPIVDLDLTGLENLGTKGISGIFRLKETEGRRIYNTTVTACPYPCNIPASIFTTIDGGAAAKYSIVYPDTSGKETGPITLVSYYEKIKSCQ